jgi:hypothetical protein
MEQLTLSRDDVHFTVLNRFTEASVKFTHAIPGPSLVLWETRPWQRKYFPSMKFFPPAS